jgi:hypothetical protein
VLQHLRFQGSRAANGRVIVITTKSGRKGKGLGGVSIFFFYDKRGFAL